jgi:hypothetical protein
MLSLSLPSLHLPQLFIIFQWFPISCGTGISILALSIYSLGQILGWASGHVIYAVPRASHSEGHLTCSTVTVLKFLMILYLNLCFVSEIQWSSRTYPWAEQINTGCTSIYGPCCTICKIVCWSPMSTELQGTHDVWKFSENLSKDKINESRLWLSGQSPYSSKMLSNQKLALNAESEHWPLRNAND